jgi:hypothetical protein
MSDRAHCPWCGADLLAVPVHGHVQCARCGVNFDPCCGGASAESEVDEAPGSGRVVEPRLFRWLFEELGGVRATVTRECLLHALARALDTDLDEARIVLDAALELGHVAADGVGVRLGAAG